MLPELNRNKRKIIFRVETYPLAAVFLVCLYFFLVAGWQNIYWPNNIDLPKVNKYYGGCGGQLPSSVIYITKDNKVFLDIYDEDKRKLLLTNVASNFGVQFSQKELSRFQQGTFFGDDIFNFNLDRPNFRISHGGIPVDEKNNQLDFWIKNIIKIEPETRFRILADKDLDMAKVDKVINVLQENGIYRIAFVVDWQYNPNDLHI